LFLVVNSLDVPLRSSSGANGGLLRNEGAEQFGQLRRRKCWDGGAVGQRGELRAARHNDRRWLLETWPFVGRLQHKLDA
jgi:hypothetical protein